MLMLFGLILFDADGAVISSLSNCTIRAIVMPIKPNATIKTPLILLDSILKRLSRRKFSRKTPPDKSSECGYVVIYLTVVSWKTRALEVYCA